MEYFFGLLKSEMFYEQEAKYKTLEESEKTIEDYIYYYNNKRIKEKLITNHHFKWWFALCLKGTITSLRLKPYNLVCLSRIAPFSY